MREAREKPFHQKISSLFLVDIIFITSLFLRGKRLLKKPA